MKQRAALTLSAVWAVLLLALASWRHRVDATPTVRCSVSADEIVFGPPDEDGRVSVEPHHCIGMLSNRDADTSGGASGALDTFLPFRVSGGGDNSGESPATIAETVDADRPEGPWVVVVDTEVEIAVHEAWFRKKNFGRVLVFGLEGFGERFRPMDSKNRKWIVELRGGERITFRVKETNDQEYYHVVEIESHTSDVFPGVDLSGTTLYIQFIYLTDETTIVEFGWGGSVKGDPVVALTAITAFGQELLENLETMFGESCSADKNVRTIEGDCNNLSVPKRGAAGHALIRMGGSDPSFPDGDHTKPSGPVHISPREISNKLCAQSPGIIIMEDGAKAMKGECVTATTQNSVQWTICPFTSATRQSGGNNVTIPWSDVTSLPDSAIEFNFAGSECKLDLLFACNGQASVQLLDDPCGNKGNYFFHPFACLLRPGEDEVMVNSKGLTDLFWTFGQFVDHDLGLTPVTQLAKKKQPGLSKNSRSNAELLPISVPKHDFYFGRTKSLEFERTTVLSDRRLGLHENQHSAYADLGQVYGVDYLRARALRTFSGGKLKVSDGDLPPFNKIDGPGALRAKVDNSPDAKDKFFVVGDIRGNEQTLLLAMHIIWMREHNLICDELAEAFPDFTDEEFYQTARAIAIAEYQSIIYDEWLPLLLGEGECPSSGYVYNSNLDPAILAVFSTAAFRFGHTMVGSYLMKLGPGPREQATLELVPLRKLFFKPEVVQRQGIDDYVRGGAWHACKEFDLKVVDELRNFLFAEDERRGHMDLVSLNLQRGRDMGLPSFNQLRELFGLTPYLSFHDFIEDEYLAVATDGVYEGNVDQCDALLGGFAEKPHSKSIVGETFHVIIKDQFTKIRDCDRFFFTGLQWDPKILSGYPRLAEILAKKVKLADILVRNSGVTYEELGRRDGGSVMKL